MRGKRLSFSGLLIVGLVSLPAGVGCRDQEPTEEFNANLAEEGGAVLLPTAPVVLAAHDGRIRQGSTRATIARLADFDPNAGPPEPATISGGATPELAPAEGVGDALNKVSGAFLNNLLGSGAGTGAESAPAEGASSETSVPAEAAELAEADMQAIATLVIEYNTARSQREFDAIPDMVAESQRTVAGSYYDRLLELNALYGNVAEAYEKVESGTQAKYDGQLSDGLAAMTTTTKPAASGSDTATATLSNASGASWTVTFVRENGAWRITDPFVPASDAWSTAETAIEDAISALDAIDNDLATGTTVESARAQEALERAVKLLTGAM